MLGLFLAGLFLVQSSELPEIQGQNNDKTQVLQADKPADELTNWESQAQAMIGFDPTNAPAVVQSDLAPGFCIHAEQGPVAGSLMKLSHCNNQSTSFKWNRDTQQIRVASNPELCVDLTSNSQPIFDIMGHDDESPQDTLLQLQPCMPGATHQKWLVGPAMKSQARPDLCISPDASLLKANATSSPLDVAYCKSMEKSQGFRYLAVDDSAELLDLATQEMEHVKEHSKGGHFSHSTEVGAAGKLHMKHGRKTSADGKIINLDISESDSTLMRRDAAEHHEADNLGIGASSKETQGDGRMHVDPKSDVDALLERISEGLFEDEDEDDELSAADLDDMLDRAVVAKRRRPPPPPPVPPKINCAWGKWGKWTSCTADCGGGTQDRERGERVPAEHGGLPCDGDALEERQCNKQPCAPPPPPPTTPPAATTPPPMMAKGGAEGTVSLTPAVLLLMMLANYRSLRSSQ